jgi:phosphoribosyl-dephospho-CoA transferase
MELARHDLVYVRRPAWRALVAMQADADAQPLVVDWADRGWPLVVRRFTDNASDGIALGLPLPPSLGKRRLSFTVDACDVVENSLPPLLDDAIAFAPLAWRTTLARIVAMTSTFGVEPRVFGSLAWQTLTGLDYLSATSDLDLLLPVPDADDVASFTARLAAIEADAPMRLDGELVRGDGAAANWRELHAGASEVLVKSLRRVALVETREFLDGAPLPC